ncbi:MAG: phage head closure protein [Phycisphaerae bacterium]
MTSFAKIRQPPITAGVYRHQIAIQSNQPSASDGCNAPVDNWVTVMTVRAQVSPILARDLMAAEELTAEVTVRIRMRWAPGIVPMMRVLFRNAVYYVVSALDVDSRQRELFLMCRAAV